MANWGPGHISSSNTDGGGKRLSKDPPGQVELKCWTSANVLTPWAHLCAKMRICFLNRCKETSLASTGGRSPFIPPCIREAELEICCSETHRLSCVVGLGCLFESGCCSPSLLWHLLGQGHRIFLNVVMCVRPVSDKCNEELGSEETGHRSREFNDFSNYSSLQNLFICHLFSVGVTQLNTNTACQDRGMILEAQL